MVRLRLEPLLWILFSAGGVVAALVIPVLLLLFGLVFPLGFRLLLLIAFWISDVRFHF